MSVKQTVTPSISLYLSTLFNDNNTTTTTEGRKHPPFARHSLINKMLQFDTEYRFDMDDAFSMCNQSMACPSTTNSFSSASSGFEAMTPISSRRSTPNEFNFEQPGYTANHAINMSPSAATDSMGRYFPHQHIKQDPEQLFDPLPITPMKKFNPMPNDFDLLDFGMGQPMGTLTPSQSFGVHHVSPQTMFPTSYMMTPTHSMAGSERSDSASSWSVIESPHGSTFKADDIFQDMPNFKIERQTPSPMSQGHFGEPESHQEHLRRQRKLESRRAQRNTAQLRRATGKDHKPTYECKKNIDVAKSPQFFCDFPGCSKKYQRNEHLKRHKSTAHGEGAPKGVGPMLHTCEWCGKSQNREDNLASHRRLHARPNNRNRGVEFIPEAVPIIEAEERARKRRVTAKAKELRDAGMSADADYVEADASKYYF